MKSSNLALRLEAFEADLARLQPSVPELANHVHHIVPRTAEQSASKPVRRIRAGGIRFNDQGLRSFRVR